MLPLLEWQSDHSKRLLLYLPPPPPLLLLLLLGLPSSFDQVLEPYVVVAAKKEDLTNRLSKLINNKVILIRLYDISDTCILINSRVALKADFINETPK